MRGEGRGDPWAVGGSIGVMRANRVRRRAVLPAPREGDEGAQREVPRVEGFLPNRAGREDLRRRCRVQGPGRGHALPPHGGQDSDGVRVDQRHHVHGGGQRPVHHRREGGNEGTVLGTRLDAAEGRAVLGPQPGDVHADEDGDGRGGGGAGPGDRRDGHLLRRRGRGRRRHVPDAPAGCAAHEGAAGSTVHVVRQDRDRGGGARVVGRIVPEDTQEDAAAGDDVEPVRARGKVVGRDLAFAKSRVNVRQESQRGVG
mmetsp:Transcript_2033/g.9203  ORF Transcript_2033/g.9203 Transcript_2033/m.9203 type:complete len:256 (-) Transcript_2033:1109-1876(-)